MTDLKSMRAILSAAVLSCAGSAAVGAPSGYNLIWVDEFNGDSVDTLKWQTKYPWGRTHNHQAYSRDQNLIFEGDGALTLRAIRESYGGKPFTTGTISTGYNKFTFTGGYVEARVLLPDTPGSWPAFWGLYTGWPPEADIMEYPISTGNGSGYNQDEYHTAFHYRNSSGGNSSGAGKVNPGGIGDLGGTYHTFGMEWIEDDAVRFFFDGQQVSSFGTDSAIAQMEYMYLIFNYAVGGWPGTPSTSQWANGHSDDYKIDWVRVWQQTEAMDTRMTDIQGDGYMEWDWSGNWDNGVPSQAAQTMRLGTQGSATQDIEWDKFKAAGRIYFDGNTAYTLGDGDESLLLAMSNASGWSRIWADAGTGGHTIKSRIEVWSILSVLNSTPGDLTFDGEVLSQARDGYGGQIYFKGGSRIVLNGDLHLHRTVTLQEATDVQLNATMYATDMLYSDAKLTIEGGASLELDGINTMTESTGDQSLGYLGETQDKIVLDNGTLVLRGTTRSRRGFTIGAGGATLIAQNGSNVLFISSTEADQGVLANAGGDLTLGGAGNGLFYKSLSGTGGLNKTGTGTWTLGSDNTYTGTTAIQDGELRLLGTIAGGSVIVQSGAELTGTGSILSATSVHGTIRPGSEAGRGTLETQNVTLANGSTLEIHLGGESDYDKLASAGSILIQGATTLRVLLDDGYTPAGGSVFDLLDFVALTGVFSTIELPAAVPAWDTSALYTTGQLIALMPGDFDGDGDVDDADFGLAFAAFTGPGNGPTASPADLDGDNDVDDADFGLAFAAFTGPGAPVNIPEPGTAVLILGGVWLLSRRRR